jgi:methionyl-tRNA formyltransferase
MGPAEMRILFLGNNLVGLRILRWLKEQGEDVAGLALHPEGKRKFGKEMAEASGLPPAAVFPGDRLKEKPVLEAIAALRADVAVSVLFDYILKPDFLSLFPRRVINLHPALLPYNRGQYPNVWSIVEGTPAGTTLHYVDEGIDTGEIIAQKEVPVAPEDTGESLYRKLEDASVSLFREAWPAFKAGKAGAIGPPSGAGTYHRTRDVDAIDEIDLDRTYTGRELIDLLRARTFPPYRGAFFRTPKGKVFLRLGLEYREED